MSKKTKKEMNAGGFFPMYMGKSLSKKFSDGKKSHHYWDDDKTWKTYRSTQYK